jgi:hypothetical protein
MIATHHTEHCGSVIAKVLTVLQVLTTHAASLTHVLTVVIVVDDRFLRRAEESITVFIVPRGFVKLLHTSLMERDEPAYCLPSSSSLNDSSRRITTFLHR